MSTTATTAAVTTGATFSDGSDNTVSDGSFEEVTAPLLDTLHVLERTARREQRSVPIDIERAVAVKAFWETMGKVGLLPNTTHNRRRFQQLIHPTFLRAGTWNRAFVKPHGYAGDYRMVEMMYDLEGDACTDPTASYMENLLNFIFRTVHSVQAVWHRRRVFRDQVLDMACSKDGPVYVLDIACGGTRYLHDAAVTIADPGRLHVTLVDQDPAALTFAAARLRAAGAHVHEACLKVRSLNTASLQKSDFDLVLSTGLFDYLPLQDATELLAKMRALGAPGALVSICNFAPADRSRIVKDWVVDWQLIYRDEQDMTLAWPDESTPQLTFSPDGGLLYAAERV
jgi:hypothetical protein